MSFFQPAEKPKTRLGYHRLLSPNAAVRVSPLCLGAMNFGESWKGFMGDMDKKTTFEILDYFVEQGGNFLDTANNYQEEESETWIGEWLADRKIRDQMVIATKFTTFYPAASREFKIRSNFQGNSAKSMHVSVEASLKKLQTDYIDLLYVHWWDNSTSIPELMRALNNLVAAGKVLYLGVSDTPAWVVSKANEYARNHGLTPFSVYQGRWSAAFRDMEREIIPMCVAEGMGIAPWGALGGGNFKTKEQWEKEGAAGRQLGQPTDAEQKVTAKLEEIAKRKNSIVTSIALAYVMYKTPYVFPIVGGRKVDHLKGNIEALGIELTQDELVEIEKTYDFDIGFPISFLYGMGAGEDYHFNLKLNTGDIKLVQKAGYLDTVPKAEPIKPRKF